MRIPDLIYILHALHVTICMRRHQCYPWLPHVLPYGTKILHGIKFYDFTVASRTVKLKYINCYYYVVKILSCFNSVKFKIRYFLSLNNLDKP